MKNNTIIKISTFNEMFHEYIFINVYKEMNLNMRELESIYAFLGYCDEFTEDAIEELGGFDGCVIDIEEEQHGFYVISYSLSIGKYKAKITKKQGIETYKVKYSYHDNNINKGDTLYVSSWINRTEYGFYRDQDEGIKLLSDLH